jgi:membrane dipeptidase
MGDIEGRIYSGYKSFQYLEPGVDYEDYELVKEIGRVELYNVPLSETEEKRVSELYRNYVIISLHEHTWRAPADLKLIKEWSRQGRACTAYEGLSASCIDAVFDNMMGPDIHITSKSGWQFGDIVYDLGMRWSDIAHQDFVIRCERLKDIWRAHDEGRIAFIPAIECATPIEKEIDRVDVLYGLGVRMMGIAFSESNMLGSGLKEESDGGLTVFGHKVVNRMNKLGMAIDIAHSGDKTSLDTIKASKKPVFISHAGARSIWNSKRMRSDEVIKACAEKGGIIGIEAAPHTTVSRKHPEMNIESVMEHFEYCVDLVGIDHVVFGLDTIFADHVGLHEALAGSLSMSEITFDLTTKERPIGVKYVKGLENPTEAHNNIVRWLVKHGYSDGEIGKIIGGNMLRALEEVWV